MDDKIQYGRMIVNLVDLNVVLAGKLLNAFTSCCETIFFRGCLLASNIRET